MLQLPLRLLFLSLIFACTAPRAPQTTDVQDKAAYEKWLVEQDEKKREARKVQIIIDAGHGGDDFGTNSLGTPKYYEKNLTLSTSLMLRKYLQRMGYRVVMTRKKDVYIPLKSRAAVANKSAPSLFVSVHYNSAPNTKASGVEIFYYGAKDKRSDESKQLAAKVLKNVIESTSAVDRGIKVGNFSVIRNTDVPAILVEGGFVTNAAEMKNLKEPKYQNKIAWGIAQGIDAYLMER